MYLFFRYNIVLGGGVQWFVEYFLKRLDMFFNLQLFRILVMLYYYFIVKMFWENKNIYRIGVIMQEGEFL